MPLYLRFLPSFDRSLRKLGSDQLKIVGNILEALQAYYVSGCDLAKAKEIAPRFFYKQLRKPFYEAGVDRHLRVVIRRDKQDCYLILAGNHDQIQTFLARA